MSAGLRLELQTHAHGWQQTSMPTGSGLLPCPVERVRSAGQKAPVVGSSSTGGNQEDTALRSKEAQRRRQDPSGGVGQAV